MEMAWLGTDWAVLNQTSGALAQAWAVRDQQPSTIARRELCVHLLEHVLVPEEVLVPPAFGREVDDLSAHPGEEIDNDMRGRLASATDLNSARGAERRVAKDVDLLRDDGTTVVDLPAQR